MTALVSALAADAYVNILTQPGHLLAFWAEWLYGLRNRYVKRNHQEAMAVSRQNPSITEALRIRIDETQEWLNRREAIAERILKPILTCHYCVSGQLGFWLSINNHYQYHTNNDVILWMLTAAMSVWLAGLISDIRSRHFPL